MENSINKEFDIWNRKPRKIRCIRLYSTGAYGPCDYKKLTVGETYHLSKTEIHDYYTYVYLDEFPGEGFNSVYFEEV